MLGQRIKDIREVRGLSQSMLAQKAMIAQSTLSYIEAGKKSPTYETLQSISDGLDMSILDLLRFNENEGGVKSFESYDKEQRNSLSEEDLRQLVELSSFVYRKLGAKKETV